MCTKAGSGLRKCHYCYRPITDSGQLVRLHTYGSDEVCNGVLRLHRDCLVVYWEKNVNK